MATYQQLQETGKGNLSTTQIAKEIRHRLAQKLPSCKFSVTTQLYSGGSSITISLTESHYNAIKRFEDISETALIQKQANRYDLETIKQVQNSKYHQLNHFQSLEPYNPNTWNNGVFLTEKGHRIFNEAVKIAEEYNYDNSDAMTDYFDVNFYLHLEIGKWDKDYKFVEEY